jgi:hypothetical protein
MVMMTFRMKVRAVTVILAALVIAACSSPTAPTSTEAGSDSAKADAPPASTTTLAPASYDPRGVGAVVGNAAPALPEGEDGALSVVASLVEYTPLLRITHVYVVVRNRTDTEVRGPEVTITGRDADGAVVVTGTVKHIQPHRVPPGGVAFGLVEIENTDDPDGVTFEYTVAPTEHPESRDNMVNYPITEFERNGREITAVLENDRDVSAGLLEVWAACFDETGALTLVDFGVVQPVQIQPGETGSSTFGIGDAVCPIYLLTAVGGVES